MRDTTVQSSLFSFLVVELQYTVLNWRASHSHRLVCFYSRIPHMATCFFALLSCLVQLLYRWFAHRFCCWKYLSRHISEIENLLSGFLFVLVCRVSLAEEYAFTQCLLRVSDLAIDRFVTRCVSFSSKVLAPFWVLEHDFEISIFCGPAPTSPTLDYHHFSWCISALDLDPLHLLSSYFLHREVRYL